MSMNGGMGLMLKSMGVDPEMLENGIKVLKEEIPAKIQSVDDRLKNLEMQNASILSALARIEVQVTDNHLE